MRMHEERSKLHARSGFTLTYESWLFEMLAGLTWLAAAHFARPARLVPEWSSCQFVEPGAGLEFAAHQDVAALEILGPTDQGCVFWIPLDDITPGMPTLAVCRDEVPMLRHVDSGTGVSVLEPALVDPAWGWLVLDNLRVGDVVRLDALTVHRTHVPDGCTEPRLSLDVRAKPA